ncbi:hypothetical protein HY642_00725 [Candidatus Woesearchaeota archaeon]|nr:hypothetical protein [Candidatus Woesearchaeota archaeon]
MMGCRKCQGICGTGFVVAGILFLLQDLQVWNFWNINWYTVLFLWMGIGALAMRSCPGCQAIMKGK